MTESILIIGKENCVKCDQVKKELTHNGVSFNYIKMEELTSEKQKEYRKMAILKKQLEMPIVIKDGEIINYKEVI